MAEEADIKAMLSEMRAEIASMKNLIRATQGNPEIAGLDFVMAFGQDDDCMPNVPIGRGGGYNNFEVECKGDGKYSIGEGVVCIGRKHIIVPGKEVEDGQYCLEIKLGDEGGATVEIKEGTGFSEPNDETSYIPLYKLGNDQVEKDYRSNFCVVARE